MGLKRIALAAALAAGREVNFLPRDPSAATIYRPR
jgi:hypothetical protein